MQISMSIRDMNGFPVWFVNGMRREASDGRNLVRLQNYAKGVYEMLVKMSQAQRAMTESARKGEANKFASFAHCMLHALKEMTNESDERALSSAKTTSVLAKIKSLLTSR